jgi:hypothetical protein
MLHLGQSILGRSPIWIELEDAALFISSGRWQWRRAKRRYATVGKGSEEHTGLTKEDGEGRESAALSFHGGHFGPYEYTGASNTPAGGPRTPSGVHNGMIQRPAKL